MCSRRYMRHENRNKMRRLDPPTSIRMVRRGTVRAISPHRSYSAHFSFASPSISTILTLLFVVARHSRTLFWIHCVHSLPRNPLLWCTSRWHSCAISSTSSSEMLIILRVRMTTSATRVNWNSKHNYKRFTVSYLLFSFCVFDTLLLLPMSSSSGCVPMDTLVCIEVESTRN